VGGAKRFEGKVALVTGAGSGIGRAVVERLVAEGASVLGVDIDAERLRATQSAVGSGLSVLEADIAEPEACRGAVDTCIAELGALDVLGNVAGIFRAHHAVDVTPSEYRRIMSVNIDGCFFLCQAAIPHLLDRNGNIVNVASNSALQGIPYAVPYSISKGGVLQLTRALAVEFLKRPLRVNAIAPAGTNTNLAVGATFPEDMDADLVGRMAGLRGLTEPEEVAGVFAFLASDEARSVTGAVYTIDNGLTVS
jgi:meso-butanediol dehydrogenase / (S,S)-butanediol dehydrogenase / diacetyl reductase